VSAYQDYLQGLAALAREDRVDPLAAAIQARLRGATGSVAGLVSPPLERDEPDRATVLMHLYRGLESSAEAAACNRLRGVLADLVCTALRREPLDYIDLLGGLIGYCEVRDHRDLADGLRDRLWGYLEGGLPCELERLPSLAREDLERASRALDLWVSVLAPMAPVPEHHRERIASLFRAWRADLQPANRSAARFRVLTLLFRTLLKIAPEPTGKEHLSTMVNKVAQLVQVAKPAQDAEYYRRRWLGLCWEFGVLLRRGPPEWDEWKAALRRGVAGIEVSGGVSDLLWTSLKYLDGLDVDLRDSIARQGNTRHKAPTGPRLIVIRRERLDASPGPAADHESSRRSRPPAPTQRRQYPHHAEH